MNLRRKIITLTIAAVLAASVVACGNSDTKATTKLTAYWKYVE